MTNQAVWWEPFSSLSFLLLIGMTLVAEGAGFHVPKGYIYAAISFSVAVEALNQLATRRRPKASRDAGTGATQREIGRA